MGRAEPVAGGLPSQRPQTFPSHTQTACPSRSSMCGARSSKVAGSRVVHRSAGSWLRSMWSSQEMSRSVMGPPIAGRLAPPGGYGVILARFTGARENLGESLGHHGLGQVQIAARLERLSAIVGLAVA